MSHSKNVQQFYSPNAQAISRLQVHSRHRSTPIWLSSHTPCRQQIYSEVLYFKIVARLRRRIHRHPSFAEMWHLWWIASLCKSSRQSQVQLQKRRSIPHRRNREEVSGSPQTRSNILAIGPETDHVLTKYKALECQIRMGI